MSDKPCDTLLANHQGTTKITGRGCPTFSLGEPYFTDKMLPRRYETVLAWLQEVAMDSEYENRIYEKVVEHEVEIRGWDVTGSPTRIIWDDEDGADGLLVDQSA